MKRFIIGIFSLVILLVSLSQSCTHTQEIPIVGGVLYTLFPAQMIENVSISLANQIGSSINQRIRIGVIPFLDQTHKARDLSHTLSERLTTHLFRLGKFDIVEKTHMDAVLKELKLHEKGHIDPDTVKRIGKLAGVDAIITGTITDLQSHFGIDCRVIDIQTGKILTVASEKILKPSR